MRYIWIFAFGALVASGLTTYIAWNNSVLISELGFVFWSDTGYFSSFVKGLEQVGKFFEAILSGLVFLWDGVTGVISWLISQFTGCK